VKAVRSEQLVSSQGKSEGLSRRGFLLLTGTCGAAAIASQAQPSTTLREVYIVPNFHPASCGWLTTFSRERIYCANSYLTHLERVDTDPNYAFVLSEINNIIAIQNFRPERIPDLKQRITEGRVELVNGMFLEPTINISGGEALVRMGVLALRWYQSMFNVRPRYAWMIDVCGTHEQMAQIASGLGFDAMVYTRKNPTGKSMFWSVSPDGSKMLTLSPGHYSEAGVIFQSKQPLTLQQLQQLEREFAAKDAITPAGAPVLILGGGDDYSCAPEVKQYPTALLRQWEAMAGASRIHFCTLSKYVDSVLPLIQAGKIEIPTSHAGTAYDFDAFWIENAQVKSLYRRNEQMLQAAEMLATAASLRAGYSYPVQEMYNSWILMLLNMDRNTLWGSAGGMVFESDVSWDVHDRFNRVTAACEKTLRSAGTALARGGSKVGLFNSLNWKRSDPVLIAVPDGRVLEGVPSEIQPDGRVLASPTITSMTIIVVPLAQESAEKAREVDTAESIETTHYVAIVNQRTGALASLRLKSSDRELLAGDANAIVAERPIKLEPNPGDFMAARPGRSELMRSDKGPVTLRAFRGSVATTIEAESRFFGGGTLLRRMRFYHDFPRIDFETELNDIPDYAVVVAEFPLAGNVSEVRRGIPYGFAHSGWSRLDPELPGWNKGIVPAVRWMDFSLAAGGGMALLDRGLTGREINGNTPVIYLLNAVDQYHKLENNWTTGKGRHLCEYSLFPHDQPWEHAAIPMRAWEYSQPPIMIAQAGNDNEPPILETSGNIVVEALRREGNQIELRFAEALGIPGAATVKLNLPHNGAALTNLTGKHLLNLKGNGEYTVQLKPQEIITMHFQTAAALPEARPVVSWEEFAPPAKLPALRAYDPSVKGHPPFGGGAMEF
jgi:alpha-mannosidase